MAEIELDLMLADAAATDALGEALARASAPELAGAGAVIHLSGELGAGKTACVRSLLHALGVPGSIRSPTYTLLETYTQGALTCVHADLYRLAGAAAVEELGLRDWLGSSSLILIEWPERGGAAVPPADLTVHLAYAGAGRRARLGAAGVTGRRILARLRVDDRIASYLHNFN